MNEQKAQAIRSVLSLIEKQFGKGAVMRMGDHPRASVDVVPTGSLALDAALGIGGLPRGRVVEIYGPESSGKTTLTLEIVAQAQQLGLSCAFIDAEHALDPDYARTLNVDVEDLLMSQPDTGEQALEITDMLVRSGAVDVIIIDSVAALVPKAELEGEMGAQSIGVQARLLSQGLRKLAGIISANNTLVIFINQIRMKIGVMFGSPETTTGGNALKFYSSVRIDIRAAEKIKEGDEIVGVKARVKVVKNKLAPPFRVAEYSTLFGKGIWWQEELVRLGIEHGVLEKSGAWISYQGVKIGQGVKNAALYLDEDRDMAAEIDGALRSNLIGKLEVEDPELVGGDQVGDASTAA